MEIVWIGLRYKGVDYSRSFEVSRDGSIRRIGATRELSQFTSKAGYQTVCVSLGSRKSKILIRVHAAVLESFSGRNAKRPFVNHIDYNRANNNLDNLEWCTQKENLEHSAARIKASLPRGENRDNSKLKNDDVRYIREKYKPRDRNFGTRGLARKYGVSHMTIISAIRKDTWASVSAI